MYDYKEIISFINCNPGTNTKTLTFTWYCLATSGGCPDDGCQLWRHSWLLCQLWRNRLPVCRLMGVQTRICWLLHWTKSGGWWTEMGGHWFLKWRQNGTFQFSHSYFKLKHLRWSALWNCWNVIFSLYVHREMMTSSIVSVILLAESLSPGLSTWVLATNP